MGHVLLIGYVDHDLIPLYLMALSNATYIMWLPRGVWSATGSSRAGMKRNGDLRNPQRHHHHCYTGETG
jgi:hypothetical protein